MITKKHYITIAETLSLWYCRHQERFYWRSPAGHQDREWVNMIYEDLAKAFCDVLESDNPRFNRKKFLDVATKKHYSVKSALEEERGTK